MIEVDSKTRIGSRIVLYDGVCGLCNRFVKFVLTRDKSKKFLFASLQSDFAYRALSKHNRNPKDLNTMYVIVDYALKSERLLSRAQAAVYILSQLGGAWRLFTLFRFFPSPILNAGYDLLAKYRYQLFGKYSSCVVPDEEAVQRFIEL